MTIDVILYDLDGAYCPPNLSAPVGGSEVELYQLADAFRRAGLDTRLVLKRPTEPLGYCRRFIFWRQVETVDWATAGAWYVRSTDAQPDGFRQRDELTTVCVSRWQAKAFATPTIVVPPMLGGHIASAVALPSTRAWVYASAANKGVRETVEAWRKAPRGSTLYLMTTGYDDVPTGLEGDGVVVLGRLPPRLMTVAMSVCRGMYYRNVAPETFGVTTAIAVKLGLELDIECVGHEACGLAESRVPQDLSEATIINRWIQELHL
jgi:hypothetical protein